MKLFASPKTKKPTLVDKKKLLTRLIVVLIPVMAIFNMVGMVQQEPAAPGLSVASRADAATSQVLGASEEPSLDSLVGAQQEKSKTSRATVVGLAYAGTVVAIFAFLLAVRRLKDRSF